MNDDFLVKKKKNEEEDKCKKRGLLYLLGIKNRRMLFLVIAFILTIVVLSTSTYAWFTSNMTVSVQPLDVQVSSGSGIQISTDGEHWKSMITLADIQAGYTNSVNKVPTSDMSPMSTVKTYYENNAYPSDGLHMFKGTIVNDVTDGTMYLNSTEELDTSTSEKNYIAFDLFLKLDYKATEQAPQQQVYFTSGTGIVATGAARTSIEYAGRMGFVVQGNRPSSDTPAQFQAIKGHSAVKIYEPNYDVHTANGLANGRDNYNITGYLADPNDTDETAYSLTGNAQAVPYYGLLSTFAYDSTATPDPTTHRNPTGILLNDTNPARFAAVTPDYQTTANNASTFEFMQLSPGVTKIRVYMWIEGQDIDCENTASGGNVQFNLGFTLTPSATPAPSATPEP